ncbi:MAG TPA: hypothetical protein VMB03_05710 [Bryobacteraceae bacterium]|nr:hypothetical protein [Bryobacteraceae bacterium]
MRPIHVIALLLAGALGGAMIMKVVRPGKPTIPVAEVVPVQPPVTVPATAAPITAEPLAPEPAPVAVAEPAKPSPMPPPVTHAITRPIAKPQRVHPLVPLRATATPAPPAQPQPPAPAPAPPGPTIPPPPVNAEPLQVSAPVPEPHQVTLNAGLVLPVRLVDGLSSERNVPGDLFIATLDKELVVEGWVIADRGSRVEGRVIAIDRARAGRSAAMALELTGLHTTDGQAVPIQTGSYFKHAGPPQIDNGARIAGGAVLGAVIGAIAGGGKGAAIGAGIGGGAGVGDTLLTRHPAQLPSETLITFQLKNPVPLTEQFH